jgi:hypothetical protein
LRIDEGCEHSIARRLNLMSAVDLHEEEVIHRLHRLHR